jgi:hypothetical protein
LVAHSKSRPNRRTSIVALLLTIVIVVSSLGAYEYVIVRSLQGQNASLSSADSSLASSLSSQSSAYTSLESSYLENFSLSAVTQTFDSHVSHIDDLNADAVAADYTPNATMIWYGDTFGLGGTYQGTSDIKLLWQTFLEVRNITSTASAVNVTRLPNETVVLKADLFYQGYGREVGNFNLTTSGSYLYLFQSGEWQIVRESTGFKDGTIQYPCAASGPCTP